MEINPIVATSTNPSEQTKTTTTDDTTATRSDTVVTTQEDSVKAAQEAESDEGVNVDEGDSGQNAPENPNTLDVTA